jgi:hypothetical protein
MVRISATILGLVAVSAQVSALPILQKRIAQVIDQSTTKWEAACLAAGGGEKCNPLSIKAFDTLLANAGDCDQQDQADNMVDLGKSLNSEDVIKFSQLFAQQPRNSPNSVAIPYCQKAPRNNELEGLFQCQFAGVNQKLFVGNKAVGEPGTIPFGRTNPVSPPGSCLANPGGPIADGTQLTDITTDPKAPTPASSGVKNGKRAASPDENKSFALSNGEHAQQLNAKFATLSENSSCEVGENACIGTQFAQCVDGKFVSTSCGPDPLTCAALPLVNSPGTSITCTTKADAESRIADTGATGGLTGQS